MLMVFGLLVLHANSFYVDPFQVHFMSILEPILEPILIHFSSILGFILVHKVHFMSILEVFCFVISIKKV